MKRSPLGSTTCQSRPKYVRRLRWQALEDDRLQSSHHPAYLCGVAPCPRQLSAGNNEKDDERRHHDRGGDGNAQDDVRFECGYSPPIASTP
jgi:hypothetical protein